ncbi:hypothetical protein EZS27_011783 [termite gut metagenome]|uniref:Uncharacterized protein n=1 Tax=termite gut metagenome TaxID=433724 RepID=A0A5J4S4R8_9ZZZZ
MPKIIRNTIATFLCGFVFTPKDFPIAPRKQATVNRVLNMMTAVGQTRHRDCPKYYVKVKIPYIFMNVEFLSSQGRTK